MKIKLKDLVDLIKKIPSCQYEKLYLNDGTQLELKNKTKRRKKNMKEDLEQLIEQVESCLCSRLYLKDDRWLVLKEDKVFLCYTNKSFTTKKIRFWTKPESIQLFKRTVEKFQKPVLGKNIEIPPGIAVDNVSDGFHTFRELYAHRMLLFLALMRSAEKEGLQCGWSRRHSDGELCFGGGWVIAWIVTPKGKEIRYHIEDWLFLPKNLEIETGREWNGIDESMEGLYELIYSK